jgi:thiosulfate/3-mercaptopyruvate sulfurtransferase
LLNSETEGFLPVETLRQRFQEIGATESKKIITYCGAGIASCSVAFVLTLLGYTNVSMYDGSLAEWSAHENLPIEKERPG